MTSLDRNPSFHTVSPLRVGGRLAVLAALCAALAAGFLGDLSSPSRDAASQVARTPATCASLPC